MRFILGLKNYHNWDKFLWSDYRLRQILSKTFFVRHAPLYDGFGELLPDPVEWTKTEDVQSQQTPHDQPDDPPAESPSEVMDWDSETETWVPVSYGLKS